MVDRSADRSYSGAEAALAVGERGLHAWRASKLAWLDAFAAFAAAEPDRSGPAPITPVLASSRRR